MRGHHLPLTVDALAHKGEERGGWAAAGGRQDTNRRNARARANTGMRDAYQSVENTIAGLRSMAWVFGVVMCRDGSSLAAAHCAAAVIVRAEKREAASAVRTEEVRAFISHAEHWLTRRG